MSGDTRRAERGVEYVLFAAVLFCAACSLSMMTYVPDDSYISFRYAENLAAGDGLRFNPSERPVEGFSNLLWILFCAVLHKVGFSLPEVIPIAGALLAIFNVTLLWTLFKRRGMGALQMLFPLLVLAGSGPVVMYAVSGMETQLYAFLLLLMIVVLDRALSGQSLGPYIYLSLVALLLSLTRPEGMVAFPVVAAAIVWMNRGEPTGTSSRQRRKNLLVASLVFGVGLLAYHAWRVSYFGEWLPTPFLSKGGGGVSPVYAWLENLKFYFVKHMYYVAPVGYYFAALLAAAIGGLKLSASKGALKDAETIAVAVFIVFAAIYFNFADWMPGMRYYAPYVAVLLLPAAHLQTPFFNREKPQRRMALFWLTGLAVLAMNTGVLAELRVIAKIWEDSNKRCTVPLGMWLRRNMPAGALLAASDVGAVPYYSRLETVDINPNSLTDITIAKNRFSIDYVAGRDPDVIVLPSRSFAVARFYPEHFEMASDIRFDAYRIIGVTRSDWFQDRCYWVYVKKDLPLLTDEQVESFPHGLGDVQRKYR
jgi:hypothetical protein